MRLQLTILLLLFSTCNSGSSEKADERQHITGDRSAVCFVYHRFGDSKYPSTNVSLADFRAHLQYLKKQEFTVMTLSDAVKYLETGDQNKKVAVITVDDGYKTFMSGAMPLLREFNFPVTLFVNTETVGSSSYLDWEELRQLAKEGVEIGNHSHSHAYFVSLPEEERLETFKKDVDKAQKLLIEHLDIEPEVFAYPYGEFTLAMKEVLKDMKFLAATAQNSGVMHSSGDFFALPRYPMANAYASIDGFAEKAGMSPLIINNETPESVLFAHNPPELEVSFKNEDIDVSRLQCFVQGGSCQLEVIQESPLKVKIKANEPLKRRRVLYTVTAPSDKGKWHWYSHLWVRPEVAE